MSSSFITALGGMRANQSWLDIIGNNLANSNTPGFKASRALFADQFSRLIKPATPAAGSIGGTDPMQIGQGVKLSLVDHDFRQGTLNGTGRTFDLALRGKGFFALSDGSRTFYSRVGAFGLDADKNMVDQRTGYRVLDPNGATFTVDTDTVIPPQATTSISFKGNLPAEVKGPLAEQLAASSEFIAGTPATMTSSGAGPYATTAGTTYTMELKVNGGAPQTVSITASGTSLTATEVANAIDALDHVAASVDTNGNVVMTAEKNGLKSTLKIDPPSSNSLASLVGFGTNLVSGTETAATTATDLNDLTLSLSDYAAGDVVNVTGTDADGSPVSATFTYGTDGTTVGDFLAFLDSQFSGATASFDAGTQKLTLTANATGEANLSLAIGDPAGQAKKLDWAAASMGVVTNGTGPDKVTSSVEVFDAAGTSHLLTLEWQRQDDGTWNGTASIPATDGTVTSGSINGVTFNSNGSLSTPSIAQIDVQFSGQPNQTLTLTLGTAGDFDGITQFGSGASVIADEQDGYGVGELANLSVDVEGAINGFFTNGQTVELGRFGVATFANEMGLESVGDNYWVESPNSGQLVLSSGKFGAAGEVVGGALEESNVDTAEEFVRMIQAQRGFQANARVITAQNEILQDVMQIT